MKLTFLLLMATFLKTSHSAHFLGIPFPFRSHTLTIIKVAEELQKYYGHTTTIIIPQYFAHEQFIKESNVSYIICKNYNKINLDKIENEITLSGFEGRNRWMDIIFKDLPESCYLLLTDTNLLNSLRKEKFDMALIDNFPNCPCTSVLAYKLSIPYVHIGSIIDHKGLRLPLSLSSMPANVLVKLSYPSTLTERVYNFLVYHITDFIPNPLTVENAAEIYAPEKPFISNSELKSRSLLELIEYDILVDQPLTQLPNMIHIGGVTIKPPKKLNGTLGDFIDRPSKGVVYISFGTLQTTFPQTTITKLLGTFRALKEFSFIVKVKDYKFEEENVFSSSWIPQNDILGHKNMKVFVTHCGHRSQFEAVYHGVPMIGLPLHSDQPFRARVMENKGYGISLDIVHFTSDDLVKAIKHVTEQSTYKQKVQFASNIFKSRKETPGQKAAFWIDHVLQYGGDYLKSYPHTPYYEYRLMDVYAVLLFFLMIISVVMYIIIYKLLCFCKLFSQEKSKKE